MIDKSRFFRPSPQTANNEPSLFVPDEEDDKIAISTKEENQDVTGETTLIDENLNIIPSHSQTLLSGRANGPVDLLLSQPQDGPSSQQTDPDDPPPESQMSDSSFSLIGYDLFKSQFLSIVSDASSKAVKHLYSKYFNRPNYIQLATDEYFSGISFNDSLLLSTSEESEEDPRRERNEELKELMERMRSQVKQESIEKASKAWQRYIGTLNVEAWATRPYFKALKYKEPLILKRLIPNKMKKSSIVQTKFGESAVIRLYTVGDGGREIGRLPEDITRILSPLLDLDIAQFETFVMMETTGRISIGDPFYLLIRCFLNNNTFLGHSQYVGSEDAQNTSPTKRRKTGQSASSFNNTKETEAEAALRLKQRSLSRLFEKLQIKPYNKDAPVNEEPILLDDGENDEDSKASPDDEVKPADELNLDQLKEFYMANQQSDYLGNLPENTTPPPENCKLELRPYQKQGLSWMLAREKEIDLLESLSTTNGEVLSTQRKKAIRDQDEGVVNPLWNVFKWPKDPLSDDHQDDHDEEFFYGNMYNGELSREKPMVKSFLKGGILADEMGLGKTISTLSLIHSVPYDSSAQQIEPQRYASKSTLIILPMSLLSQWKMEFDRSNNNKNHRCFIYYGETVQADFSQTLCKRDSNIPIVVLTTYGTVQNEWARLNKMRDEKGKLPRIGLYSVEFFRIVLDEGHNIRNRTTKTAKSVHELELRRKWVLTGTPVVNRLDDIFSIVKFLRLDPWSNFSYWKTFVTLPFEQKKFNQTLDVVKSILQPIFLRRTKSMKLADGTPLVSLPDKEVMVEELDFSKREQLYYDFFKSRAYQSFKEGMNTGDLMRKYTQILTHILRLRQICCHPDLVSGSDELDDSWKEQVAEFEKPTQSERYESETAMKQLMFSLYKRLDVKDAECSICTQAPISLGEMTVTECGHTYCFHCLMEHIDFQKRNGKDPQCPDCRGSISKYRLFRVRHKLTSKKEVRFHTREKIDDPEAQYNYQLYYHDPDKTSAKINALAMHLRNLRDQSPGESVVVFSQFSSYLDLIENELKVIGNDGEEFEVFKFDGRLNMNDREKILQNFAGEKKLMGKISVLLLSLKAGGVGLNLTCASRAFMMDPWWSPSVEDQAIDRIHRIGQSQNVKVVRFIIKNSIENKMLRIQERKRMMGEAVEVEEEERRKQRIEEIKLLFEE